MAEKTLCPQCESRPPRRNCPALAADICAVCCGTEREVTINCPLECEHLRAARLHDKPAELDPKTLPNPDIELTDSFMNAQQALATVVGRLLLMSALETPGAVDYDMRETLDAIVRSYRTAESGLIYQTRPNNILAATIQARFEQELAKFREDVARRTGAHTVRDKDLLGVMVFWQRMEWQTNNGRRKGRAFIESLYGTLPPPPAAETQN